MKQNALSYTRQYKQSDHWTQYSETFLHNTWIVNWNLSEPNIISWGFQSTWNNATGNFRAPNIISWGLSFIKFQDGTLNFISLATITSAHQWITDWQEHSWIMEQYRSLPVTAFCENGQTEQIELLGEFHKKDTLLTELWKVKSE